MACQVVTGSRWLVTHAISSCESKALPKIDGRLLLLQNMMDGEQIKKHTHNYNYLLQNGWPMALKLSSGIFVELNRLKFNSKLSSDNVPSESGLGKWDTKDRGDQSALPGRLACLLCCYCLVLIMWQLLCNYFN